MPDDLLRGGVSKRRDVHPPGYEPVKRLVRRARFDGITWRIASRPRPVQGFPAVPHGDDPARSSLPAERFTPGDMLRSGESILATERRPFRLATREAAVQPERRIMKERWEAGGIGCGRLVMELHNRIRRMAPGDTLEIVADDPGASTDLPAWCRMTGNTLLSADPPLFVIRREES
jgi:tRNA 2-thiouridine synthesizing protein A